MRPLRVVLHVCSSEQTRLLRRMQFSVRTSSYWFRQVRDGREALQVLSGLQSVYTRRVDSIDLLLVDAPLGEPLRPLLRAVRAMHPRLRILLAAERLHDLRAAPLADAFWSHRRESSVALFQRVERLALSGTGPKPGRAQLAPAPPSWRSLLARADRVAA